MAIEKTDAEAFCNDTQQEGFIRKIFFKRNEERTRVFIEMSVYGKEIFLPKRKGRGFIYHFFVAEIDEYLKLLLLYLLCLLSKHIFRCIIHRFCCLWTQKCVGGKLLNWFYVLQWMWYRGCTNVLPRGKLFLLYIIRWYTKRGKVALQDNHQFLSRNIVININLILLCLVMFH